MQIYNKNEPNTYFNCLNAILFSIAVCQIVLFFVSFYLLSCNVLRGLVFWRLPLVSSLWLGKAQTSLTLLSLAASVGGTVVLSVEENAKRGHLKASLHLFARLTSKCLLQAGFYLTPIYLLVLFLYFAYSVSKVETKKSSSSLICKSNITIVQRENANKTQLKNINRIAM